MAQLSLKTPDATGYVPNLRLADFSYFHIGRQNNYTITDFVWLGETDRWGVLLLNTRSEVYVVRPVDHLDVAGKYEKRALRVNSIDLSIVEHSSVV